MRDRQSLVLPRSVTVRRAGPGSARAPFLAPNGAHAHFVRTSKPDGFSNSCPKPYGFLKFRPCGSSHPADSRPYRNVACRTSSAPAPVFWAIATRRPSVFSCSCPSASRISPRTAPAPWGRGTTFPSGDKRCVPRRGRRSSSIVRCAGHHGPLYEDMLERKG